MSHVIPEPRNFAEVTILPADFKKARSKANLKEIKNPIKNQTFLMDEPEKRDPVTPFMDVYKEKNQSDGSVDKLKLIIVVIGDLHNKEMIGDTWAPTASMRTLKYFLSDDSNHK